jgi:hypothetical protein
MQVRARDANVAGDPRGATIALASKSPLALPRGISVRHFHLLQNFRARDPEESSSLFLRYPMSSETKNDPDAAARKQAEKDANRDPLSGRAGAHPVGTGVGAAVGGVAGGAATGAVVGTAAGPVGTAVGAGIGAAVGAVVGGLAGKAVAENADPTVEHGYWKANYARRPYVKPNTPYAQYGPAYQYGWEAQSRYAGKTFDESEPALRRDWDKVKGKSELEWEHAKHAVRDSWNRVSKHDSDPA